MFALPVYSSRWRRARARYLQQHPLCTFCEQRGVLSAASVVDHIKPHRNDPLLFWNPDNWQALCKPCHDRTKRLIEERGQRIGSDADGIPVDASHHWHR